MEPYRDDELSTALRALRPTPAAAFAAELDARVAAGFPRRSPLRGPAAALDRVRALKPRQVLLPAGATALAALLIATVVTLNQSGGGSDSAQLSYSGRATHQAAESASPSGSDQASAGATEARGGSVGTVYEAEIPTAKAGDEVAAAGGVGQGSSGASDYAAGAPERSIERSAELTLGTEPENVGKASSEVFDVVHDYRGVVLSSRTSDGSAAHAEAEFELLIPSGKLGDAMAAFSGIAEVRSRHEATDDITAPTVTAGEQLEDSEARIDSLLAQLADAETESEREAVETELRGERNRAAALRASLQNLERRASLSRVSLRILGGEGSSTDKGGAWGIGDALDDAGQILAVGAAVTLVTLAVLGPIALVALLAWLAHRAWVRRGRRQALG